MEQDFLRKMAEQPPLTADLLVHKIYSLLEDNILSMNLLPETKLVEDNIAKVLGVSRSPVREALSQLEDAGLVRKAGKGRVVTGFSEQEIIDNYQVWGMIEGFAGGLACLEASTDEILKIEDTLIKMKSLSGDDRDRNEHRRLNYIFHHNIVLPCRNKLLIKMYEKSLKPIMWCWNLSVLWKHDRIRAYNEHRQILDAYVARNRETYERLVRKHIDDAAERMCIDYARRKENLKDITLSPQ